MAGSALVTVLVDLVLILAAAKALGWAATKLGQPAVIGEITAGILAGPTVLGTHLSQTLFPPETRPTLAVLANIGIAAFMFLGGLELDLPSLRRRRGAIGAVSLAAYMVPFALGCVVGLVVLERHQADDRLSFALFLGCALAVTAFPVLARILHDTRLIHTGIGQFSLACAALVDLLAWAALAVVLALSAPGGSHWRWALVLPAAAITWWVTRPLIARIAERAEGTQTVITLGVGGALLYGALTEWIGLHLIFGAFLFGLIFPRAYRPTAETGARVLSTLLMPGFFVVAGLAVDLSSTDRTGIIELVLIVAAAVGGKLGGAYLAARVGGLDSATASVVAVLLNTRGLTELVILHIGYTLGLLDTGLYSMLVVMALLTTAMTAPTLRLLDRRNHHRGDNETTSARAGAPASDPVTRQ
ncbi:cation:proton antiporter [Nocardia takedensis]|uniref:cation:proton antiporter n=1 Tax=Nocardia takedensis TaxID=259390 RepID=UPI0003005A5C|nr:cation:proton antiporter [Nocardia takedensis]